MKTIKKGSTGADVRKLQELLLITIDGIFGAKTEEAVKKFQRDNGLEADGIVGPKTWEALGQIKSETTDLTDITLKKSKRKITEIIVHCAATPEGKNYTVEQIRRAHLQRGFSDIGYHYVIYLDGSVHKGRNVDLAGAHCTGHNQNSIGICYIGGCAKDGVTPKDTRTEAQKKAMTALVKNLMKMYGLSASRVYGHYQFANKACPSFKIDELRLKLCL